MKPSHDTSPNSHGPFLDPSAPSPMERSMRPRWISGSNASWIVITIDTSGMLALLDRDERHHEAAKAGLLADAGPYIVPAGTLCELGLFVRKRGGGAALDAVIADLEAGSYTLDCGDEDLPRIRELLRRYADLNLGFTDAAVIACAERNGGKVLTFDRRDFDVVAREGRISVVPA